MRSKILSIGALALLAVTGATLNHAAFSREVHLDPNRTWNTIGLDLRILEKEPEEEDRPLSIRIEAEGATEYYVLQEIESGFRLELRRVGEPEYQGDAISSTLITHEKLRSAQESINVQIGLRQLQSEKAGGLIRPKKLVDETYALKIIDLALTSEVNGKKVQGVNDIYVPTRKEMSEESRNNLLKLVVRHLTQ